MSLNWLPWALIIFRLVVGPTILFACLDGTSGRWVAAGLGAGILSDILDGRLARRLGGFDQRLRVLDSRVDTFFFICVAAAAWLAHASALRPHWLSLIMMFTLYALSLFYPYFKFKRMPAYHAYSAKAAGLALFAAGAALFVTGQAGWPLEAAIIIAIVSHLDRIAITYLLPAWCTDVVGFWAV